MRRLVPIALATGLVLAACGGGSGETTSEPAPTATALSALSGGTPLPEATLTDLRDESNELDLGDLGGQPTILNFWATWCAFCVEEMPDLEQASQALDGQVRFVGIDREDPNRDAARELAAETGVTYDLAIDPDGSYFRAVQGRGMPTTVFVDEAGIIQYRHAGPMSADQLLAFTEEHLGIRPTS